MKRVEVEADQMPGQDSFLDVITNIVGILILLVLVVGLRTSHSVHEHPGSPDSAKSRGETEYRAAFNNAIATERDVRELIRRAGDAFQETDFREQERAWLSTNIAAAEQEITARRGRLTADEQRDFDLRQKLATAQATLDDLTREQVALIAREPDSKELECQPTPIARSVSGKEVHVLLADDHLAIVPLDEFVELSNQDFQANVWRLKDKSDMVRTIGPIDGFRFQYRAVRKDVAGTNASGAYVAGRALMVDEGECIPISTPTGEPAQEALRPQSDFFQRLQPLRPEATTITIWVYPGNFERLRELKVMIRQMGYAIAVRPLPKGVRIGASRHGTRSLSE